MEVPIPLQLLDDSVATTDVTETDTNDPAVVELVDLEEPVVNVVVE